MCSALQPPPFRRLPAFFIDVKAAPKRSTHSVVALIDVGTRGNALVIPVSITAERSVDGVRMDVNMISSAYEKNVSALVKEAVAQFNTGDNSVFYVKKEAADLLGAGVQFPEQLKATASYDGIVRKLDSKINMSIENVTQSQQLSAGLAIGRTSRRRRASKSRSKTAAKRLMRWIWLRGHLFLRI